MGNAVTWSSPVAARQKYRYLYKKKCETKSRIEAPHDLLEFTDTHTHITAIHAKQEGIEAVEFRMFSVKLPTTKHPQPTP